MGLPLEGQRYGEFEERSSKCLFKLYRSKQEVICFKFANRAKFFHGPLEGYTQPGFPQTLCHPQLLRKQVCRVSLFHTEDSIEVTRVGGTKGKEKIENGVKREKEICPFLLPTLVFLKPIP